MRIPIIIPINWKGFINQGSGLSWVELLVLEGICGVEGLDIPRIVLFLRFPNLKAPSWASL